MYRTIRKARRALTRPAAAVAAIALLLAPVAAPVLAHDPDAPHPALTPSSVDVTVAAGGSVDITKTVHTPAIPQRPDIVFLADITGSMGGPIGAVQASAAAVLAAVDAATTDPRYGAASYSDVPDPLFFLNAAIPAADDNGAAALAGIASWATLFGGDGPESQLHALHRLALHNDAAFRPTATKIVVWFGDAPGHDPVCAAAGSDHLVTEASVTAELVAAGIKVIAISTLTGYPAGLDDDPTLGWAYVCGAENGTPGQASRIAAATGGIHFAGINNNDIADAIIDGLGNVSVEVSMTSDCSAPISTTFSPASQTVVSGDDAVFTETISVAADAAPGVYECRDWALIDGQPMTDANGEIIYETKRITVAVPYCVETVNPHGNNIPKAPGNGGQGQNQDGFYEIGAEPAALNLSVFVVDDGTGTVFGPFPTGTKIKYTEANDAVPSIKAMGGNNGSGGSATAVAWHIKGQGDAAVVFVDAFGNRVSVSCLVPPPPK